MTSYKLVIHYHLDIEENGILSTEHIECKIAKTKSHICQGYYCYFFPGDQYPPTAVWALITITDYLLTPPESCTESTGLCCWVIPLNFGIF